MPVGVAAREALLAVSAHGPPTTLPSDADLDLTASGAAAAYGQSYVAARLLAMTYGQQALVDVYRDTETALAAATLARPMTADQALDAALLSVTGSGLDVFVAAWRLGARPARRSHGLGSRSWPAPWSSPTTSRPVPGGSRPSSRSCWSGSPPDSVVVYASSWRGAEEFDRGPAVPGGALPRAG